MTFSWVWMLLTARSPYLLYWRIGSEEYYRVYAHLLDALLASQETLELSGIATMALTDRAGRSLPVPAYALLTWRWGGVIHSEVLAGGLAREQRIRGLQRNEALEFVSLTRSDGSALLTPAQFEKGRRRQTLPGASVAALLRPSPKGSSQPPPSPSP